MPSLIALVDIGTNWPRGDVRDVSEARAALLSNSGWATPADTEDLDPENPADPAPTDNEEMP